jgi:flagellar hook protein FlgE
VALAKFQNNQALFKVGGNLFQETRLSGDPTTSRPGTNGLGSLSPNSLEQSNVDIAQEFVKMITTQRGFQANSKIITVTDQMLAELINIKR